MRLCNHATLTHHCCQPELRQESIFGGRNQAVPGLTSMRHQAQANLEPLSLSHPTAPSQPKDPARNRTVSRLASYGQHQLGATQQELELRQALQRSLHHRSSKARPAHTAIQKQPAISGFRPLLAMPSNLSWRPARHPPLTKAVQATLAQPTKVTRCQCRHTLLEHSPY